MDQLPQIFQPLMPFLAYLWFIPVGILSGYVGWRIRGVELRSTQLTHQEVLQTRELRLRTLQIEMDRRDLELEEKKTEDLRELSLLRKDVGDLQPLRVSLNKYKTQLAEVNAEKIAMERKLANERDLSLRKKEQNEQNIITEQTFEDKFYSLQTKYKQMDAKRSLEIVSLKADIVELRKATIISGGAQDSQSHTIQQLQTTIDTLEGDKAGQETSHKAITRQLKDSNAETAKLKDRLRIETGELSTQIAVMDEKFKSVLTTKNALEKKTAQYDNAIRELAIEKKQTTNFREKIDELTATGHSQLSEYDKKIARLSLKLDNAKEESHKEINKLQARRRELESLSTVNKNQERSIERLESQLTEQRKHASGYQKLKTDHVSLEAELQKKSLKLKTLQSELDQNHSDVNKLSDKLQRSEFENKKIDGIKALFTAKTIEADEMKKELASQSKIRVLLERRTEKFEAEQSANKILGQQLELANNKLSDIDSLKKSYEELQSLKPKLSSSNKLIVRLESQLEEKEKQLTSQLKISNESKQLSAEVDSKQNRIASLLAEFEKLKSTNETLSNLKPQLEEYKLGAQKHSEAHIQRGHKISDLEQQLLGQKQTISQLNRSIAEYRARAERANKNDKALAIAETSLTKQKETAQLQRADILTLNAELAKLDTLKDKLKRTQTQLATRNTELADTTEKFVSEKSKFEKTLARHKSDEDNNNVNLRQLYAQITELKEALKSSKYTNDIAKAGFETKYAELKSQHSNALSQERESFSDFTSKIKELNLKVKVEREKRSQESVEHEKSNAALKALESSVTSLNLRLKEADREKTEFQNEIEEQSRSTIVLREKIDARSIEITNLKKANQALKEDTQATEKILEQEQQLNLEKSISKSLESKIASITHELKLSQEQTTKFETKAENLHEEKSDLVSKLSTQATKRQESENALKDMRKQLEIGTALESKLDNEIEEKQSISKKLRDALKDVHAFKEQATQLEAEKSDTSQMIESLESKIENQSQKLSVTDNRNKELSGKLQSLILVEADIAEQDEEIKKLRAALNAQQDTTTKAQNLLSKQQNEQKISDDQSRKITALQDELRKSRETSSKFRVFQDEVVKLRAENQKFRILQASVQDRQTDINRLQRDVDRLAGLEGALKEKEKEVLQLKKSKIQLKDRDSKIAELNQTIANFGTSVSQNSSNDVDLNRLRGQVESLTRERDLGLERVREMAESTKTLAEREKTIKQLKNEISDDRVNHRDLEALRLRIQQNETELHQKNETIEDLKRLLQSTSKTNVQKPPQPKAKIIARGAAVAKTRTEKSATTDIAKPAKLFKTSTQRDNLKKIYGIGPVMEKTLNELGITSYQQIANFSKMDIDKVTKAIDAFPGRVERDDWIGGARKEHKEKYGEKYLEKHGENTA